VAEIKSVNDLLKMKGDCRHIRNDDIISFDEVAEDIAIDVIKENFFNLCQYGVYAMIGTTF
jgi:hypothetical protein